MAERKFSKRLTPQGAESRERLLQGAIDLISERGYAATSVDAICRHAGTAKTALYWHFKSKEGLLNAIIERVNEDWVTEITRSTDTSGEPAQRLDIVINSLRNIVETKPHLLRLLLSILLERGDESTETRESILKVFGRSGQALMAGIEKDIGHPIPRVDMVAHTILGLLQMALVRRLVEPDTNLDVVFADLRRTTILIIADRVNNPGIYSDSTEHASSDRAGSPSPAMSMSTSGDA